MITHQQIRLESSFADNMATSGIMAKTNFVSQSELLAWLNSTLALKLEKIEDTCSGAVACQLIDALHGPGSVNMKRVDFNVKSDYEFVQNYKELQKGFVKHKVDRAFHVSQLSKGKRQVRARPVGAVNDVLLLLLLLLLLARSSGQYGVHAVPVRLLAGDRVQWRRDDGRV